MDLDDYEYLSDEHINELADRFKQVLAEHLVKMGPLVVDLLSTPVDEKKTRSMLEGRAAALEDVVAVAERFPETAKDMIEFYETVEGDLRASSLRASYDPLMWDLYDGYRSEMVSILTDLEDAMELGE